LVAENGVKSAARTLEVLEWLAAARERPTLSGLAAELGVPKSSLRALLQTLQARGWIETDPTGTRYGLGVRALLVGAAYVETDDVVALTRTAMDDLSRVTGETVHLARLDGTDIVYLAKRESHHPIRLYSAIGRRLPAFATALGKALLSERSADQRRPHLPSPLPKLSPGTITDPVLLDRELARTRDRGYAVDNEENTEGIRCWAVTLPRTDPPVDALSISVPVMRLTEERSGLIATELVRAREALGRRMVARLP
jgi:DNA-binding IclR family transcriptional regulator